MELFYLKILISLPKSFDGSLNKKSRRIINAIGNTLAEQDQQTGRLNEFVDVTTKLIGSKPTLEVKVNKLESDPTTRGIGVVSDIPKTYNYSSLDQLSNSVEWATRVNL